MIAALQIESLLTWLKDTLQADSTLLSKLDVTDVDLVCASALELEPVGFGDNGLVINVTEFPFLCAREASATTIYAGPVHGQEADCKLWYGIKTPIGDMSGTHPVPHRAHADRWLRTVYWRLLYWFRKHERIDIEMLGTPPVATPVTYDVMTIGQIHTLLLPTMVRYRHVGDVSLFEADFKMRYILPPWAMTDPTDFERIEYRLGSDSENDLEVESAELITDGDMEALDTSAWPIDTVNTSVSKSSGGITGQRLIVRATVAAGGYHAVYQGILVIGKTYRLVAWNWYHTDPVWSFNPGVIKNGGDIIWTCPATETKWWPVDETFVATSENLYFGHNAHTLFYSGWDDVSVREVIGPTPDGTYVESEVDLT